MFSRYAAHRYDAELKSRVFREYVADGVRMMTENTARAVEKGTYLGVKYGDIIRQKRVSERSEKEIIADMLNYFGEKEKAGGSSPS